MFKITSLPTAAVIAASLLLSTPSFAEDKATGSGPNPFTDCGIGAALFPTNTTLALTSNAIWDLGSTAITSATASPETCNAKTVAAAKFILETFDNLAVETARGEGDHLAALMNIMEIDAAARPAVVAKLRSQMGDVVGSEGYINLDRQAKASAYFNSLATAVTAV